MSKLNGPQQSASAGCGILLLLFFSTAGYLFFQALWDAWGRSLCSGVVFLANITAPIGLGLALLLIGYFIGYRTGHSVKKEKVEITR